MICSMLGTAYALDVKMSLYQGGKHSPQTSETPRSVTVQKFNCKFNPRVILVLKKSRNYNSMSFFYTIGRHCASK